MNCDMHGQSRHSDRVAESLRYQGKFQTRHRKQLLQLRYQMFSSLTGRLMEPGFQFLAENFSAMESLQGSMPIGSQSNSFPVNQAKELAA
jgi:hypothetical protein